MAGRNGGDLCRRHGFQLVEALPGRAGGSVAVLHVQDRTSTQFVLKKTEALRGAGEIAVMKAASDSGVVPRFMGEIEPRVYRMEWLPGRSLAECPLGEVVDGAAIGRVLRVLHQISPPPDLRSIDEWLQPERVAQWSRLSPEMRAIGMRLAARLCAYGTPAPVLLHGDLVPANVLLTGRGPRLLDPVGFCGLPAWDLAQLAVSAAGRGRLGMLPALLDGYGADVPQIADMVGWMLLFYLDKNRAIADSPFIRQLQPLAERLLDAPDTVTFLSHFTAT